MILFIAVHLSLISATAIKTAIQCDLGKFSNFPFQIWILHKKLVQVQVEHFPLQQITYFHLDVRSDISYYAQLMWMEDA